MPSPSRISPGFPPIGAVGWLYLTVRLLLLFCWLCFCVPMQIITRLLGGDSRWARRFLYGALRIMGARIRSVGTPLQSNALFLANHQSWLDIMAIGGTSRARFLSKAEIGTAPLIGWLAGLNDTVYIARSQRLAVARQVEQLRNALNGGRPITMFPEGTTSGGMELLPFKPALLKVLEPPPPGLAVQPVYIDFGKDGHELCWNDETGLYNGLKIIGRRNGFSVTVHYLPPIDPSAYANRKAITAQVRVEILSAMDRHRAEAGHSWPKAV